MDTANNKTKIFKITGICTHCDNRNVCDSIKDITELIKNGKSTECIINTDVAIYNCNKYRSGKSDKNNNMETSSDHDCVYCYYPKEKK